MTNHNSEATERQPLIDPRDRYARTQDEQSSSTNKNDASISDEESSRLAALQALPWYKRPGIGWLIPFVFVIAMVLGLSAAPQEQLTIKIICKEYFRDRGTRSDGETMMPLLSLGSTISSSPEEKDPCKTEAVTALAALVLGHVRALKYVSVTQILIVYMALPTTNLSLGILYADGIFMGIMGAGILLEPCINAYIADSTPRQGRSLLIGYVMVFLAIGMTVGPLLGGFLSSLTEDGNMPMLVSVSALLILTVYVMFLPESLPKSARLNAMDEGTATNAGAVATTIVSPKESLLTKTKKKLEEIFHPLLLLLPGGIEFSPDVNATPSPYTILILTVAYGFLQFANNGAMLILIPYTNLVFGWGNTEDGYYYGTQGAFTFVVYLGIFPALQKLYKIFRRDKATTTSDHDNQMNQNERLCDEEGNNRSPSTTSTSEANRLSLWSDLTFFILGSIMYTIGYMIVPLSNSQATMFISCALRALGSIALPSFTSLLTSFVPTHQTGRALGGIAAIDVLVLAISSFLFGWIFSKTSAVMPAAVYLVCSLSTGLTVLAGLVLWVSFKRAEKRR
ncbi:hypothetical protein FBU30_001048 [Linnemannia zychae]|nr:hypothetical protein FBU30_001048 [Linnemannia zychae]